MNHRPFLGRGATLLTLLVLVFSHGIVGAGDPIGLGPPGGNFKSVQYLQNGCLLTGTYNGRLFFSSDYGTNWTEITPVNLNPRMVVEQIEFHKSSGNIYIAVRDLKSGFLLRTNIAHLLNRQPSWDTILPVIPIRSIALTETNPPVIYVGTDERFYRSDDGGGHWSISLFQFPDPQIESIALDKTNPDVIYAGTWQRAFKTVNKGKTWLPIHAGMAPDSDVFTLKFDSKGKLYAGTCGYAYVSSNQGKSWTKLQKGFTGKRVHCIESTLNGKILAGTNSGLYMLDESGAKWNVLVSDHVIHDITIDDKNRIYCTTEGEGIIRYEFGKGFFPINSSLFASSPRKVTVTGDGIINAGLVNQNSAGGFWCWKNDRWQQLPFKLPDENIWDYISSSSCLVVGTSNGIFIVDTRSQNTRTIRLLDKKLIHCLFNATENQRIYIGAVDGMYILHMSDLKLEPVISMKNKNILRIWGSPKGRLYAGCDDGLFMFSQENRTWIKADLKIDRYRVNDIIGPVDGSQTYFATDSGIFMTPDQGSSFARLSKNLPETACVDLCFKNDTIFALLSDNSVYQRRMDEIGWTRIVQLAAPVWTISVPDHENCIYFGSDGFGVLKYPIPDRIDDPASNKLQ